MDYLTQAAVFFGAAVMVVPIFRRLGLGAVLGYLAAGAAIGPFGLSLIDDVEAAAHLAEFGVVLLLFIIGLELSPSRLWTLRSLVFGLGGAQVLVTGAVLAAAALFFNMSPAAAIVVGLALAFSSTAFVLQTLAERGELKDRYGRCAFAILLFQDVAAIPLLAAVPLLGGGGEPESGVILWDIARVVAVLTAVIVGGHALLRPVLRVVARTRIPELFTATALLIVSGTALLMDAVGISMALGAFLAGVLLANTEYRHQLEADIEPFKGLLLGLFFMSVGMGLNLALVGERAGDVAMLVVGLLAVKAGVVYALGRVWDLNHHASKDLALALPQGGEFAFVVFAHALVAGVLARDVHDLLILVVSLSIAATPLMRLGHDWLTRGLVPPREREYDVSPTTTDHPVIIAGFGRFGQITGRVLAAKHIPFIAMDASADQVDFVKRFGNEIYYGDASRLDLLRAARAGSAKILVLAIDDVEASLRTAETVAKHFPNLLVYARARNRQHAYRLMDLGVRVIMRETFLSSLDLTREVLRGLGMSAKDAARTIETFREHDERRLAEHHTHYNDQEKMRSLAKASARELEEMFTRDLAEQAAGDTKAPKAQTKSQTRAA